MQLTPKTIRLLSLFQAGLGESKDRIIWRHWTADHPMGGETDQQISEIALQLARIAQTHLNSALSSGKLDEDQEADAVNDLQLFRAVERTYQRERATA